MTKTTAPDLDELLAMLIETGFSPLDDLDYMVEEEMITERNAKVLGYFAARMWDAFRFEDDGLVTLIRWSEDGFELLSTDVNGVTYAEARFTANATGMAWLTAAIQ